MRAVRAHTFWLKFMPGRSFPALIGASNGSVLVILLSSWSVPGIDKMPDRLGQEIRSGGTGLMNIDQKKGAPALAAALALALVVSTGAAPEPAPQPSPRVNHFLGGRAAEVLARADRAQAFRLTGERAKEDERAVGWYRIQSAGREQDGAFARKVAGA